MAAARRQAAGRPRPRGLEAGAGFAHCRRPPRSRGCTKRGAASTWRARLARTASAAAAAVGCTLWRPSMNKGGLTGAAYGRSFPVVAFSSWSLLGNHSASCDRCKSRESRAHLRKNLEGSKLCGRTQARPGRQRSLDVAGDGGCRRTHILVLQRDQGCEMEQPRRPRRGGRSSSPGCPSS